MALNPVYFQKGNAKFIKTHRLTESMEISNYQNYC